MNTTRQKRLREYLTNHKQNKNKSKINMKI
jgi:hypothetical protein